MTIPTPSVRDAIRLIEQIKKSIIFTKHELSHLFEIGLEEYLLSQTEKHIEINTFFHQENKINFYDVYYKLEVISDKVSNKIGFESPINELKNSRYVAIIGTAGSGKSMLTKYIYLQTIQENRKIPVLLELRLLDAQGISLEDYIFNQLLGKGVKPNYDILKRCLKDGVFLIILDGYDEIYSNNIQVLISQIEDFIDKYKENHFIITSRPGAGAERLPRFKPHYMKELQKFEIIDFVKKLITNTERRDRMLASIRNPDNTNYLNYLSNPLLLSMFLMTFQKFPEIPKRKSDFYHNVFDTLYSRHDGITKNSFVREKKSGLDKRNLEYLLAVISYQFFLKGKYEFSDSDLRFILQKIRHNDSEISFDDENVIYDLTTTLSLLVRDGLSLTFPHRSLQEYFTAIFIHSFINSEEQKNDIYTNLINGLFKTSLDSFYNFWDICKEIDEIGFQKNFILTYLKQLRKLFQEGTEALNLIGLFTLTNVKITVVLKTKFKLVKILENEESRNKIGKAHKALIHYYIHVNFNDYSRYNSFLNYLDLNKQIGWFNNFMSSKDFKDSFTRKLSNPKNEVIFRLLKINEKVEIDISNKDINKCLIEIFKESNLSNRLKIASKFLDQRILDINEKINMNIFIKDSLSNPML
jgi:hypothetical protein